MKNVIVITSIFEPTHAVEKFSKMEDYQLVVVGDKKTPTHWHCENVIYLSVEEQEALGFRLLKVLPYNHYSRKMIGYLWALKENSNFIIDTDDDNIPKENWSFPKLEGEFDHLSGGKGFVNIYQGFTEQKIWPRGLPLNLITTDFKIKESLEKRYSKVGVWQGLADEDPDVDAIYRLTDNRICVFEKRPPIVLGPGTISPFNTQNTLVIKELFPLLYLPMYVTFRFTDILRGLIFQPIMWLYNYNVGFLDATVVQKRNPHDYTKDFISEIPMYEYGEKVCDIVSGAISSGMSIEGNLFAAYEALQKKNIVTDKEVIAVEEWLKDIKDIVDAR